MTKLVAWRDLDTPAHLLRVRTYARLLAEQLAASRPFASALDDEYCQMIYRTSCLHDIGKRAIPHHVLAKPGRLSRAEYELVKTHTTIGAAMLDEAIARKPEGSLLSMARTIAATHHERFDGGGYPNGLAGRAIPLCGRIVALADVYDALTTRRVYKPAYPHELARSIILRNSGGQFDPSVVGAFLAREDDFRQNQQRLAEPPIREAA